MKKTHNIILMSPALESEASAETNTPLNCTQSQSSSEEELSASQEEKKLEDKQLSAMSCAQLVETIAVLLQGEELPPRSEIERIKSIFFKKKNGYAADPNQVELLKDAEVQEIRFRDLINDFKEQNKKRLEEQNLQKEQNLARKKELIEELRELLTSTEDFNQIRTNFHTIGENWRSVGAIPEPEEGRIHKEYGALVEQFYDLKQINDEFREYDFKKNLEAKQVIIEQAKELLTVSDTVKAVKELHELHNAWRDLGPVARDLRKSIWEEFKEISSLIHKKNNDFFEQKHAQERENLKAKEDICVWIESIDLSSLTSVGEWNKKTKEVLEQQKEWKKIGFASHKSNDAVYSRFRAACDAFFDKRSSFFGDLSEDIEERLKRREALAQEAEDILGEGVSGKNAKRIRELQDEWYQIGFTPRKLEAVHRERFSKACSAFFKQLKAQRSVVSAEQNENLQQKQAIIEEAKKLLELDEIENQEDIYQLIERFHKIGHVPMRQKEQVYKDFNSIVDELMKKFKVARVRKRVDKYESNIEEISGDKKKLLEERDRLNRIKERIQNELNTYSNNLGFFNISSNGGSSLLRDVENKQKRLQDDIDLTVEKIRLINEKLKEL